MRPVPGGNEGDECKRCPVADHRSRRLRSRARRHCAQHLVMQSVGSAANCGLSPASGTSPVRTSTRSGFRNKHAGVTRCAYCWWKMTACWRPEASRLCRRLAARWRSSHGSALDRTRLPPWCSTWACRPPPGAAVTWSWTHRLQRLTSHARYSAGRQGARLRPGADDDGSSPRPGRGGGAPARTGAARPRPPRSRVLTLGEIELNPQHARRCVRTGGRTTARESRSAAPAAAKCRSRADTALAGRAALHLERCRRQQRTRGPYPSPAAQARQRNDPHTVRGVGYMVSTVPSNP